MPNDPKPPFVVRNAKISMQEHVYVAKKRRIIKQSFFIWFFVTVQITANIMLAPAFLQNGDPWGIVFINLILSVINIPAVFLFLKYYKHSVGKELVVTYNSLRYRNHEKDSFVELFNSDINEIKLVVNSRMSRLPWLFHEYFSLADEKGNRIVVTSYFMDISEFWLDPLTGKVDNNTLLRVEKVYPLF